MAQVSKVSVALTPELAAMVNEAVDSGDYATTSEVIREALREWKQRRTMPPLEVARLQGLWAEGIASGPGRFASISEIKSEARRRLNATTPKG